ncbi:MAG: hypothetical protein ABWY56_08025, partial [Propionibacteriaceae bacterium]
NINNGPRVVLPSRPGVRKRVDDGPGPIIEIIRNAAEADEALAAKQQEPTVAALLNGAAQRDEAVGKGAWRRPFPGADLYWSHDTGAHEVHGDIRAKYDALGGAGGRLGLPVTDESGTPDGYGRYNHFQGGSIYWTDHTGAFLVFGGVRDAWAAQGWERGPLGYPVADQHTLAPMSPADHPQVSWTLFENGAAVATADGSAVARHGEITPTDLRRVVRRFFDEAFSASPDNVGLHPPVDLVNVSAWGKGFWSATPRSLTFALHGFHDNGLWADTDFKITVGLTFRLVWSMSFTEPTHKTLVVSLEFLRVTSENNSPLGGGIAAGPVVEAVTSGVHDRFFRGGPDPAHPEVPDGSVFVAQFPTGVDQRGNGGIDVIDVLTTSDGGLQVLVNPLPLPPPIDFGLLRSNVAQSQLNAFVDP